MNDGGERFLMSFNDTLTCGLGASILLFLVFVILANVMPVEEDYRQGSLADASEAGWDDEPIRAPISIRVHGGCESVEAIRWDPSEKRTIRAERRGIREDNCVVIIMTSGHDRAIDVRSRAAPSGLVVLTVSQGGRSLTGTNGARRVFAGTGATQPGGYRIARVWPGREHDPIEWGE